jgi:hypothetical protein
MSNRSHKLRRNIAGLSLSLRLALVFCRADTRAGRVVRGDNTRVEMAHCLRHALGRRTDPAVLARCI